MCDFRRLQERIRYVAETPNAYCVLGGDLMDTAIASSIGDTYAATHSPMEQLRVCKEIFAPIAQKTLCCVHGNHENRIYRESNIDTTELMCSELGILDKYSPTTALCFIRFGNVKGKGKDDNHKRTQCYSLYLCHGSGCGRKSGSKVNRLVDLAGIVDADVYVMNHTHSPAVIRQRFFRADTRNNAVQLVEHLFVNSAANLDYGGYGDVQGYTPTSKQSPVIWLCDGTKRAYATL